MKKNICYALMFFSGILWMSCRKNDPEPNPEPQPQTVAVSGISLNNTTLILEVDSSEILTAYVTPQNATNKAVVWSSSIGSVATVDNAGKVTAVGEGVSTVTVITSDGGMTAQCEVTVYSLYRASGSTGPLTWTLSYDNTLTISGNGAMPDYSWRETPWYDLRLSISTLVIGDKVTSIGERAFEDCRSFAGNLIIPNSVTSIGAWSFWGCSRFTGDLIIPNSVTSIGEGAFQNCIGFTDDLIIPNSVTSMGERVFYSCWGFTGDLTISNSVTSIERNSFAFCNNFTGELTIGNSVNSIGDEAFNHCNGFTGNLIIPNSVTSIGDDVFAYCNSFTGNLIIPNSVTSIGERAFIGCSGFSHFVVGWTIPLSVHDIFNFIDLPTKTLHVPAGTKEHYQATSVWQNFGTIVEDAHLFFPP